MTSITLASSIGTPTVAGSSIAANTFVDFLLAELACAAIRARLLTAEIDSAAVALRGGLIDADGAMAWMAEIGALGLIATSSAIITST